MILTTIKQKFHHRKEMIIIEQKYIKSPLNYVGGKFKLLPQIIPLFPTNINTFVDLFGGGFNVGINVQSQEVVYNDLCLPVVQILEYLHNNATEETLSQIDTYIDKYQLSKTNDIGFKQLREDYNNSNIKSPIMLYTLICYAFNNQIRFNSKGEFNMPFGKDRSSFNSALREKFKVFVEELHRRNFKFVNSDFRDFSDVAFNDNDFLYCDPPYFNSTAVYNENNGWNEKDENDLLTMLKKTNVKWALSNNLKTNPSLKDWAEENNYSIHYLNGSYGNCNYHKKDKQQDIEVLITNY